MNPSTLTPRKTQPMNLPSLDMVGGLPDGRDDDQLEGPRELADHGDAEGAGRGRRGSRTWVLMADPLSDLAAGEQT